jgi:hypothetical protein
VEVERRTLGGAEDWARVSALEQVGVFHFVDVGAWDALIHSIKSISLLRANPTRTTRLHGHIQLALLIRARPRRVLAHLRRSVRPSWAHRDRLPIEANNLFAVISTRTWVETSLSCVESVLVPSGRTEDGFRVVACGKLKVARVGTGAWDGFG